MAITCRIVRDATITENADGTSELRIEMQIGSDVKTTTIGFAPGTVTLHGIDRSTVELGGHDLHRLMNAALDLAETVGLELV